MNKTKIIATIGPSSKDEDVLKDLILNGMDVARLNLSYSNHDFCLDIVTKINKLNDELKTNVAVMFDTEGPDIRIGKFTGGSAYLKAGSKIRIYIDDTIGDSTKFSINYPKLIEDVKYSSILRLNDGRINLVVVDKGKDYLLCEVKNDGIVEDYKSVNIPGIKASMPFLSRKDIEDIKFAHKIGVDFLALSFVSTSEDILKVNDLLINLGNDHMGIIAKVENESAVREIDDIIRVCDGVMIARGDLGVELPMERVPGIQKAIISKCHIAGKVSIVATELLSSMEHVTRPTRAEVSDVANAVLDGVDAVMLSGETTVGQFPVDTMKMMERIIKSSEEDINYLDLLDKAMRTEKQDTTGSLAYSVADTSNRLRASCIVAPTISGYTARKMSRFRPFCPIIAVSPNINTVKSLALHFGVNAILIDNLKSFDKMIDEAKEIAINLLDIKEGSKIIITGGYPFDEIKHTNFMKIEEI